MRFEQAVRAGFRNYAAFGGRAGRAEFWWWILFTTLVSMALNAIQTVPFLWISSLSHVGMMNGYQTFQPAFQPGGGLSTLWSIAVLLPTLGLSVRRLRDAGYRWGHLFWLLLPIAGLIVLIVLLAQPSRTWPQDAPPDAVTAASAPGGTSAR